ncbi:rhamnogalacturonan acetylesterase [Arthrobacter sp. 24S4-2]|uniref:rhamnogalacturonan acetylesterase n=1 Tax=Arthrobacter sp. 24S4-2 TaxID=2575374 RepID=UPI0010C7D1B9|nr:rhamnogalacturonan acetylesterase [Arthrobacter sp. 24S4-2]QCO99732.1 rhamnogalacturonan acetylesterase [Arthrobacter sp. 24S4-2]
MKILLAGDSTVANCPTFEYPMSGWGAHLAPHVYTWAAVHNFAKGGASTESFRAEGLWDALLELAGEGDLVLIQFGHNDQKRQHLAARTGYAANLRRMAAEIRGRRAVPLLCTSVERRHFLPSAASRSAWSRSAGGGSVGADPTGARLEQSLEDYPDVVRELAAELHVPVIDLNTWTRGLYTRLGEEGSRPLFCHFGPGEHAHWPEGLADNTHFSRRGALLIAREVAGQLGLLGFGPDVRPGREGTTAGITTAGRATAGPATAGRG